MKSKVTTLICLITGLSTSIASAEGSGSHGGDPRKIDAAAIRILLEGDGLKNAMLNYLKTLKIDQVSDPTASLALARMLQNGELQRDILTPGNYELETSSCQDAYDESVPASARIGEVGGKICFNVNKLAELYSSLGVEDAMIRLASLAFHEHVHHFQDTANSSADNENEAYRLAAYVQITAKVEQIPLLKWSPDSAPEKLFTQTYEGKAPVRYTFWGLNGAKLVLCPVPFLGWFWACISDRDALMGEWGKKRTRYSEASLDLFVRFSSDNKISAIVTTNFTRRGCQTASKIYVGIENEFHTYDLYENMGPLGRKVDPASRRESDAYLSFEGGSAILMWRTNPYYSSSYVKLVGNERCYAEVQTDSPVKLILKE